jgi:hypothetical protein
MSNNLIYNEGPTAFPFLVNGESSSVSGPEETQYYYNPPNSRIIVLSILMILLCFIQFNVYFIFLEFWWSGGAPAIQTGAFTVPPVRMCEKKLPRRIFGPKREEAAGGWREIHNLELQTLFLLFI